MRRITERITGLITALLMALLVLSCSSEALPDTESLDDIVGAKVLTQTVVEYEGALGIFTETFTKYKNGDEETTYALEDHELSYEDGVFTCGIYTLILGDGIYDCIYQESYTGDLGDLSLSVTLSPDGTESYVAMLDGYEVTWDGEGALKASNGTETYTLTLSEESYETSSSYASVALTFSLNSFYLDDSNEVSYASADTDDYSSLTLSLDGGEEAVISDSWSASFSFEDDFSTQSHTITLRLYDRDRDEISLYDVDGNVISGYTLSLDSGDEYSYKAELCFYPARYLSLVPSEDVSELNLFDGISAWTGDFTVYVNSEKTEYSATSITASSGDTVTLKLHESLAFPVICLGKLPVQAVTELPKLGESPDKAITSLNGVFTGSSTLTSLSEDLLKDNTQLTDLSYAFSDCTALTELPSLDCLSLVTDMSYAFSGCTALSKLSSDLFSKNTEVKSFKGTFKDCTSLAYIPEEFFDYNTKVTDFSYLFSGCTSLSWMPSDLFTNCTMALTFAYAFQDCGMLSAVPSDFFSSNTRVQDFSYVFHKCYSLTYVPDDLFLYNTYARSFMYAFYYCSASSLDLKLYIGSELVEYASYFSTGASNAVVVYLKGSDTTSYTTFTNAGVTVEIPETWPE